MSEFAPATPVSPVVPVLLEGRFVRLEPLVEGHRGGLVALNDDAGDRIFLNAPIGPSFSAYLDAALAARKSDDHVPFVVRRQSDDATIGMSRLFDIKPAMRGLEIGFTWYHPAYWGGTTNPECKLLLMSYVFETLGYGRVQLKTDERNTHSQAAMARMGAAREGTLRHHMVLPDGRWRNSVYFSVLAREWPRVKEGLRARLAKADAG